MKLILFVVLLALAAVAITAPNAPQTAPDSQHATEVDNKASDNSEDDNFMIYMMLTPQSQGGLAAG